MFRQFASRFRDEIDGSDVVGAVLLVAVASLFDLESTTISILVGVVVGAPLLRAAVDAAGLELRPGPAGLLLGSFVVAAGAYTHLNGNPWLAWTLVAIGAWLLLDGIDKWRRDDRGADAGEEDDMSRDELFRYGEYNRWLLEELREADRPLTAEEIRSRTGLTDEDLERLLEIHGDSGPIERVGNGYVVDERELGAVAFVRNLVRTVGGRLLRPFRLFRPAG